MTTKIILATLIFATLLGCNSNKKENKQDNLPWTKFHWIGNDFEGKHYDKSSIYLPVELNGTREEMYAQLDLGSSFSMLYEISVNDLQKQGLLKSFLMDSTSLDEEKRKEYFNTNQLEFKFNNTKINKDTILIRKSFGGQYNSKSKNISDKSIGTIGVDFFKNKILIMDYPNERICVLDSLPNNKQTNVNWQNCEFNRGSPLITLQIAGKDYHFIFDTGSSLFALLTTNEIYQSITDNSKTDTLKVPSWGNVLTVVGKPIKDEVKIGNLILPKEKAYFFLQKEIEEQLKSAGIDGLTGNKLFLGNTIYIDFKNGRFGVE